MMKKNVWKGVFFLLPSMAGVSIFVLLPFLDVLRRAFTSAIGGQFVGISNFQSVLTNDAFRQAAGNSIRFTVICIPLLLLSSLSLSLWIRRIGKRGGFFKSIYLIPMAIPVSSIVLLWKYFFHGQGLLNGFLHLFGISGADWMNTKYSFWILVFTYLWKNIGYDVILWLAGLSAIPESIYEAARVDGAGERECLFYVTLPNLLPSFFTITVLSLLNSFKVFREAWMIAGNYPHDSIYMLQNLFNNWFTKLDMQKMTAGAVMLAAVLGIFLILCQKAEERWKQ